MSTWRRDDVARATERIRAILPPGEPVLEAAACEVRIVVAFTAVIAVTERDLYVGFARAIAGTRHAIRLTPVADVLDVWCRTWMGERLIVRGRRRTWRFLHVEPAGRAQRICERLRSARIAKSPSPGDSQIRPSASLRRRRDRPGRG